MGHSVPPFGYILLAQSLGAFSELFGQRLGRQCHRHSNIRMLISASTFSSAQSIVLLGIGQLFLPTTLTGGQGSLTMIQQVAKYPGLLVNAVNNAIYWLAMIILLKEPLGPLLVVLGFLCASFLVGPFESVVGLPGGTGLPADAVILGIIGALLCVIELPLSDANGCMARLLPCVSWAPRQYASFEAAGKPSTTKIDADALPAAQSESPSDADTIESEAQPVIDQPTSGTEAGTEATETKASQSHPPRNWLHALWIAAAFAVLALTSAIGIVFMTYYETVAGLSSFGYAAVDSGFLPLTMLPLAALIDMSPYLRGWIGEPRWSEESVTPPHFMHTLVRTWSELCAVPPSPTASDSESVHDDWTNGTVVYNRWGIRQRAGRWRHIKRAVAVLCYAFSRPWSYWFTLIPFHGIEFARTLLFFWLVTAFDVEATYLQMTLVRIALVWGVSLLACSLLKRWVGISDAEAAATLHPANVLIRVAGTAFLVFAVLRLKALV